MYLQEGPKVVFLSVVIKANATQMASMHKGQNRYSTMARVCSLCEHNRVSIFKIKLYSLRSLGRALLLHSIQVLKC